MADRSVLQTLLGSLPDDKLMAALQVVLGGGGGGDDTTGDVLGGMAVDNHIQPWSQRMITFGGKPVAKPPLVDKKWISDGNVNPPQGGQMLAQPPGDTNPFLQSGGGS